MRKRILSLLLVFVLALSLLPVQAFAADSNAVGSAAEFAAMEAGGSYELTADITVSAAYSGTFTGTFDGKGHTVTLDISGIGDNVALFQALGDGGTVKNVITAGSVSGGQYVAGIAATSSGTIENCLNTADITAATANAYAGGIAGRVTSGTVTGCGNTGAVSGTDSDARYVAGLAGESKGGSFTSCFNRGTVTSPRTRTGASVGGLVGNATDNTGRGTTITNCYNTGTISVGAGTNNYGAIAGWLLYNATVSGGYYLDTSCDKGVHYSSTSTDPTISKTEEEMKSAEFAALLGDGFIYKAGGYPALAWQIPTASVAFTLSPADAVLTINGGSYTGSCRVELPQGDYSYTVSRPGYGDKSGSISVSQDQAESAAVLPGITVELEKDESLWSAVTFALTPADAAVEVKDADAVVAAESDGSYALLKGRDYTYTVSSRDERYEPEMGSVTPAGDAETVTVALRRVTGITLGGDYKTEYTQGDALDTTGLTVTVAYADSEETTELTSGFAVTGFDSSAPAESQTLTVSYRGATAQYTISIAEKSFPSTIFNPLKGKAVVEYSSTGSVTEDAFTEDTKDGETCLRSNNKGKSSSSVTAAITFTQGGYFQFDYRMWAEGGNYDYVTISYDGKDTKVQDRNTDTGWKTYAQTVEAGKTLTIKFQKDSSTNYGDDCVWLRNFAMGEVSGITLRVTPADATVVLTKEGDTTAIAGQAAEGVYSWQLLAGSYTYTVSKFGYTEVTGTVTLPEDTERTVTLTENAKQTVTFSVTKPEGMDGDYTLTVKHGSDVMAPTAEDANVYSLYDGTYTYTVTHDRCETVTGTVTVEGAAVSVPVTLEKKWTIADYFEGVDGVTPANGTTYAFVRDSSDPTVLASNNQGKGSSKAILTLTIAKPMELTFQYKVGSESGYDKLTIVQGTKTLATESGVVDWKTCTVTAAAGDVITITYAKDYSGDRNGDTVWLKGFAAQPLYRVTFTGVPEGAAIEVRKDGAAVAAQTDGTWLLTPGDYTYSVTAAGYKSLTDQALKVEGADVTVPVSMQASSYTFEKAFADVAEVLTAANDETAPFSALEGDEGGYLQSANNTNCTTSSITLTFTKPARLSFQYWVSEEGSIIGSTKYGLVVKRGGDTVFQAEEVSTQWNTYTLDVNAGETVTIAYSCYVNVNSMTQGDENFLRLRAFQASSLCAVTFTGAPEGADITVRQGENTIAAHSGSVYLLEAGSYTYSVSAFGYVTKENEALTVSADETAKEVSAALTATETHTITFAVTPADADIALTHREAGDMSAFRQADGTYRLPAGEDYTFTVSKAGYISRTGSFTADADRTITVPELVFAGVAWDGTTKTQPQTDSEGAYLISNAEELAWFADAVNGGATTANAKVTANINLGGKTWTAIGSYSKMYTGRFDGGYKLISGLAGETGLFDYVGESGYVGAVAVDGTISGSGNIGGIVDTNYGTVENCLFKGSLTVSLQYAMSAGGIVGRSQGASSVIRGCVNLGAIHNACTSYAQDLKTGGIVGYTYGTVENSYNMGRISAVLSGANGTLTNKGIGGVVGTAYSGSTIHNVYNAGSVTGPSTTQGEPGAIIGTNNSADVANVWYLTGTAAKAAGTGTALTGCEKTAAEMQKDRFAYELGDAFRVDTGDNGGFPVLAWQGGRTPVITDDNDAVELDSAALTLKTADGTALEADADGKYQIKEALTLLLEAQGKNGTSITWSADPAGYVDLASGAVTLPTMGKPEVTLTATLTRGEASAQKEFSLVVWSSAAGAQKLLDAIKTAATADGVFIQPLEVYDHSNITQAMEQYLLRNDYEVDATGVNGIAVTLVSAGEKLSPSTETVNLAADGTITYYTDIDAAENYATYQNVTFRLTLGEAAVDVPMTVHIGWSESFADDYMLQAANSITWDMIRGGNTNSSTTEVKSGEWWQTETVAGTVSENLTLPLTLAAYPAVKVAWMSDNTKAMTVKDNGNNTYTGTFNRPVYGQPDLAFLLRARVSFDRLDDYMKGELSQDGESYEASCFEVKLFNMTIAASDEDTGREIYEALEKYPTLLRDFVNKTQTVDSSNVTADMQMPRPATLEEAGIMPDSYNEKVTMVSKNTDVLEFNGYHAVVYRPLPGSDPVTATYTITILDRASGVAMAARDFTITIAPLTQQEIDDAKAFMQLVSTTDVYWEGIKAENPDKDNVTTDLHSFSEILPDGNGGYTFVRGAANLTFGGVEVDDLPGYDPMGSQPWREFRSSRESIITCENLLVTRPEYDTQVTIDSVLTHTAMAKYWTKFKDDPAYAQFAQFYQQPVSVTVTVKGTAGTVDPDPTENITVTVSINGDGFDGFLNAADFTFQRSAESDWTAWEAVEAFLDAKNYVYEGGGSYISSITDPNGVELAERAHGEDSGWLYYVNGVLPDKTLAQYILQDNDRLELFYSGEHQTTPGYTVTVDNRTGTTGATVTGLENPVSGETTFNVTASAACVVAVSNDGGATYTVLEATANGDGSYSFTTDVAATTSILVVVKGDVDGDGSVTMADAMAAMNAWGSGTSLSTEADLAGRVTGNDTMSMADAMAIMNAWGNGGFDW